MDEQRPHPYLQLFSGSTFAFNAQNNQQIEQRRAALNDVLLFDILLTSGGIRAPDTLYPPSDVQGLSRLLHAIEGSKYDRLKKNCLVYFLLKWHKDEREKGFAEEKSIMPQFVALADAYWYLDSGYNVARAISNLSDPRLNRDYASKIKQAIDLENKPQLIVKYVRCAQPLLTEPDDIDLYTICLAEGSLLDAWQFIRTFHDRTRARLLEKLLRWTVTPIRPEALSQLLSIPLTKADEDLLQNLCTNAPLWLKPPALYVLQDLACTRLVQVGRHVDAIKLDRRFCSVPLKEGWSKGGDEGRRKMIQELIDALPSVERAMLDVDVVRGPVKSFGTPSKALALDMSWEDGKAKKQPLPTRLSAMDTSFQSTPGGSLRDSSLFGSNNRSVLGMSRASLFDSTSTAPAANQGLGASTRSNPLNASTSSTPLFASTASASNNLFASTASSNPLFASTAANANLFASTSTQNGPLSSTTPPTRPLFASTASTSNPLFTSTASAGPGAQVPPTSRPSAPPRQSNGGTPLGASQRENAFFQPPTNGRESFRMVPLADVTMGDETRMEEEEAVRGLESFTPDASLRASAMAGDQSMWDAEEAVRGLEDLEADGDTSMHVEEIMPRRVSAQTHRAVPGGWSTPEPMTPEPAGAAPLPTPSPVRPPPPPKPQTNGKTPKQNDKGKAPEKRPSLPQPAHYDEDEADVLARSVPGGFEPPVRNNAQEFDDHDTVPDLPPPVKEKARKPRKRSSVASAASLTSLEDEPMSARRRSSRLSQRKR